MKTLKPLTIVMLAGALLATPCSLLAADKKPKAAGKPKPYPLKTCLVKDEALDQDAHVFVYQGQEIKTCCDGCESDFLKDPAKFLKKIEAAQKKPAK